MTQMLLISLLQQPVFFSGMRLVYGSAAERILQ